MINPFSRLTLAVCVISVGVLFTGYYALSHTTMLRPLFSKTPLPAVRPKKVAFIIGAHSKTSDSVLGAIRQTLESEQISFIDRVFPTNRDQTLLMAQVKEIIEQEYDIIYALGGQGAQMALQILENNHASIPLVYSSVLSSHTMGLMGPNGSVYTGKNVTGVASTMSNPINKINALLKVRPDTRKIVIAYNANIPQLEADVFAMRDAATKSSLEVRLIPIANVHDVQMRIQSELASEKYDVLVMFRDDYLRGSLPHIQKMCELDGVTIYAADRGSVVEGAALGYSCADETTGLMLGAIMADILSGRKQAIEIPVQILDEGKISELLINPLHCKKQGITTPLGEIIQSDAHVTIVTS